MRTTPESAGPRDQKSSFLGSFALCKKIKSEKDMLSISDLQLGVFLTYNNQPHQVVFSQHSKLGRGGAILRTKLKNLITGAIFDVTFKGNDKVEEAEIKRTKAQFTYKDGEGYHFMDGQTYEQFTLKAEQVGQSGGFLKEGENVDVISWNSRAINVSPPIKVDLKIAETEPGIRGNTAQGSVTKPAILETGAKVLVPIFMKVGDTVKVNTQTGEYVERVNK